MRKRAREENKRKMQLQVIVSEEINEREKIQKEKEEIDAYERKWGPVMPRAVRPRVTRLARTHVTRSKLLIFVY